MQLRAGVRLIEDDILVDLLGVAVRRECFLQRRGLVHRQVLLVRLTIYGTGRREDDIRHLVLVHQRQEVNEREDVIAIVFQRLLHRFAYSLACRKMYNSHDIRMLYKDTIHLHIVAAIDIEELRTTTYNLLYTVQDINIGVTEIVHNEHLIALLH